MAYYNAIFNEYQCVIGFSEFENVGQNDRVFSLLGSWLPYVWETVYTLIPPSLHHSRQLPGRG
jgi:hypothetical protein